MAFVRILASLGMVSLSLAAHPQAKNLTFEAKLKSVAVFRDGYGFFVREGQVKLENGWATTNFLPTAIRGTLWVYSLDPADKIDTLITTHDNTLSFSNVTELKEALKNKVGLQLSIELTSGQKFEGKLNRLLDDMLLLEVGSAYNAIPYGTIKSVSLVGYPIKIKIATSNPNKVTTLGIAYLQEGIRWEPSYVLDLKGQEATLSLRASIQNTTEPLKDTDVLFVVGSPYIANRGISDMIALMPGVPTKVDVGKDPDSHGNEVQRGAPDPDRAPIPSTHAELAGEEAGELYYYKKPSLDLNSNDVAMVSVFDEQVPIRPSFEWNADGEEVLYILNLQNSAKQPLTTGPVFVLEDKRPIGQDMIQYTPAGGKAELHLARGIGLHVEKREAEVKRSGPIEIGKTSFIPVTLAGTLKVTNYRKSEADVHITRTLRGKVADLSDGGKIKDTQIINGEPNPVNDVEWKVKVAPGQTKTISYTLVTYMSAERAGSPPIPAGPTDQG
jgi:hypothetical protein